MSLHDTTLVRLGVRMTHKDMGYAAKLLTPRELEIAMLLQHENIKIAAMLDITTHTVRAHVRSALAKTGAETRTELALMVRGICTRY